jgi:hypothetical protein
MKPPILTCNLVTVTNFTCSRSHESRSFLIINHSSGVIEIARYRFSSRILSVPLYPFLHATAFLATVFLTVQNFNSYWPSPLVFYKLSDGPPSLTQAPKHLDWRKTSTKTAEARRGPPIAENETTPHRTHGTHRRKVRSGVDGPTVSFLAQSRAVHKSIVSYAFYAALYAW